MGKEISPAAPIQFFQLTVDHSLKELLTLLESDNTAEDLQLALSRISISAKEPRLVEP